ncbi:hypothetical protein D3C71_2047350 [compost metagenome]
MIRYIINVRKETSSKNSSPSSPKKNEDQSIISNGFGRIVFINFGLTLKQSFMKYVCRLNISTKVLVFNFNHLTC